MDSVKSLFKKCKWVFIILSFIIIDLPQWFDALWDLAEKYEGRALTMPHISLNWLFLTIPFGLAMFGITIWAIRSKRVVEVKPATVEKSGNLTDTLTAMHRRLLELQKEKAIKTKISPKQWEKVMPTLARKMGTIKLEEWNEFEKSIKKRIKQKAPKPIYRQRFNFGKWEEYKQKVYDAALSVAFEVKEELFKPKQWTFEEGIKISEWLDGYNWGVKKLRDDDKQWDTMQKSISHYFIDEKLRVLIKKHVDFSYFYNNFVLTIYYSEKYSKSLKTSYSSMLHEALIGSPISPIDIEIALGELLEEIQKRLIEIGDSTLLRINTIEQIVEELLTVGIYSDCPVNITIILYKLTKKLEVGLSDEVASNQEKLVLSKLNIRKIVQLEQRKVEIYGSDNIRDVGYWILTELGKEVIAYLEVNKQVFDNEGSLSK